MKKITFLLISVCFLVPAYGQFQLAHGTERDEYGTSVRTLPFDKAFIIGGHTYRYYSSTSSDATLLKVRYDGRIMWSKVYGLHRDEIFSSVRPISLKEDKGYVCFGSTSSIGAGNRDMLLVRTDPVGNPLSVYTYGGKYHDDGQCIQVIRDPKSKKSALIMIGSRMIYRNNYKMFVVKARLDGSVIDAVMIGDRGRQHGYWIEQTRDGGFIAVGGSNFACGMKPNSNTDIFVVKLKYNLDLEWARTIGGGPGRPNGDIGYSVKETKEGYIITGYTSTFTQGINADAFLLKLDHGGNLIWLRNYGLAAYDVGLDVLNDESAGLKHKYVLSGYTTVNNHHRALLVGTDNDGNIIWKNSYGTQEGLQFAYEIDRAPFPGYVFTGPVNSFGPDLYNIYHVATNNIGNSYCPQCEINPPIETMKHKACIRRGAYRRHIETGEKNIIRHWNVDYKTLPCDTIYRVRPKGTESEFSNTDTDIINWVDLTINPNQVNKPEGIMHQDYMNQDNLVVYPNPANKFVRVEYPEAYRFGNLKVFNNTGQLILSKELLNPNSTEVTLDNLDIGIYMITVISEEGGSLNSSVVISK